MQLHGGLVSERCYREQSAEEEYILEGESTGLDDGLSAGSEGEDVAKITPRTVACLLGAWRCFRGEWDKIWGKIGFSLTYFSDTRETSKAIGICELDVQKKCLDYRYKTESH